MRRPGHLLCLAVTLLVAACAASADREVKVSTAQQFAQAVADFGTDGVNTTIYLPRGGVLSLANVTPVNAQVRSKAPPVCTQDAASCTLHGWSFHV